VLIDLLVSHSWLAAALLAVLYTVDHVLTRAFAARYQALSAEERHISYERGVELNPAFAKDVAQLRWLTPRFLIWLVLLMAAILVPGALQQDPITETLIGALILEWIFLDLRNIQNLFVLRDIRVSGSLVGYVSYW